MPALLLTLACTGEAPPPPVVTPAPPPVDPGASGASYVVRFPAPSTHRVVVEASVRCEGPSLELWMPVWTPGSYLVREHARFVEAVSAHDSEGELPVDKAAKNRWRVACRRDGAVTASWTVYARTLSVRESYVDDALAVLNPTSTFLVPDGAADRPLDVRFELPPGWSRVETALPAHPDGAAHHFLARDLDHLVDAPVLLGNPVERAFEAAGVPHRLVAIGEVGPWDPDLAAADAQAIATAVAAFWGTVPYRSYAFLVVLADARGGGLEHRDSTLVVASRWGLARQEERRAFDRLLAHEHFHAWNVKAVAPAELVDLDYEREDLTRSLWVAEGLTTYYAALLVRRAALSDDDGALAELSDRVRSVQEGPGRVVEPLSEASLDAWIEHYRPDEDARNRQVDYYDKGAVVGWLLDAEIRRATDDRRSLDDAMRALAARAAGRGYTPEDVRAVVSETAGRDLGPFFDRTVDRAGELDFGPALQWWGLRFAPPDPPDEGSVAPGWLGATTDDRGGRLVLAEVLRGTPAWDAGLSAEDELLAIDGFRVLPGDLDDRLAQLGAGRGIELLVARRGVVRTVRITLGGEPATTWKLEPDPGAGPIAHRRRMRWLSGG